MGTPEVIESKKRMRRLCVNNGQLRLHTPPRVVHTSRLDQYNWLLLFQAENGQKGVSNLLYKAECYVSDIIMSYLGNDKQIYLV